VVSAVQRTDYCFCSALSRWTLFREWERVGTFPASQICLTRICC